MEAEPPGRLQVVSAAATTGAAEWDGVEVDLGNLLAYDPRGPDPTALQARRCEAGQATFWRPRRLLHRRRRAGASAAAHRHAHLSLCAAARCSGLRLVVLLASQAAADACCAPG